jgi:hypothetical protein
MDATNDRRRGALIGLAVGDALGVAVEFSFDFGSQPQEHAIERKNQAPASRTGEPVHFYVSLKEEIPFLLPKENQQ